MPVTGVVFDIQRCSLYDGPGIRTSVFLKGCPLHCIWCHNPESQAPRPQLSFCEELCVQCLRCVPACPEKAHFAEGRRHRVDFGRCKACGRCCRVCAQGALKIVGETWDAERLLREVERDRAFYDRSGGGVTLTGGEPMLQAPFTREILRLAKQRGIHTCLETCGFAPEEEYREILPYTDLFLFDYKETDPEKHRKLTGASNEGILKNLDFLYRSSASIVLRCPLIPGVNDFRGHLEGIAALGRKYPRLGGIELMAYHDMGEGKRRNVGMPAGLKGLKTADETVKNAWLGALHGMGCTKAVMG